MIINGFGGGSGGFEGTSTLVKTVTGSYSTTRDDGKITTEHYGEADCNTTSYNQVWHTVSSFEIGNWSSFNNVCNSKAMKIVFRITSLSFTGKIGLFVNRSGTTAAQTLNLRLGIPLTFTYKYIDNVDWATNVDSSSTYQPGTMGGQGYYYTQATATMTGNVPSVPSSGSYVTKFSYPSLTWTTLPDPTSAYFIQALTKTDGTRYWRPYGPQDVSNMYTMWADGPIYAYLDCYACGASGGNASMSWKFYESSDGTIWPILTMNYAIDAYAIN